MNPPTSRLDHVTGGGLVLGGLGLAVLVRLWVLPLPSSLSLDECGTWWVTNGGFGQILSRARLFPQSIPYAAIVWGTRAVAGASEIALRLPSLLAAGLAVWCLYRLGQSLFDRETGLLAAAIFAAAPQVCFEAGDARPYAFGVLATIVALRTLVRWLERGKATDAVAYIVCAAAAVYFQYLFASMLVAHAIYAILRWRQGAAAKGWQLLLAGTGLAVLLTPALALTLEIGRDREVHAFGVMPGVKALTLTLGASSALAALMGSALVCWIFSREVGRPLRLDWAASVPRPDVLWLLGLSVVVPPLLLFAVSRSTGTSVFIDRYMACILPSQTLLMAWCLRGVQPTGGRRSVLAGYLLILLVARGLKVSHTGEDWRGAVAAVDALNADRPVLLAGTYAESKDLARVKDPSHAGYMRAPLDYYRTSGQALVLPLFAGPAAESYVEGILSATPGVGDRFALIERPSRFPPWAPWLEQRLRPRGYRMRRVGGDGSPGAWVFDRARPPG